MRETLISEFHLNILFIVSAIVRTETYVLRISICNLEICFSHLQAKRQKGRNSKVTKKFVFKFYKYVYMSVCTCAKKCIGVPIKDQGLDHWHFFCSTHFLFKPNGDEI